MFQFKQFSIRHDKCPMKMGTDAVLLGAWANIEKATNILDIGTGCGVIALMLAQRSKAKITGIDICNDACMQASENAINSPWADRLTFINLSIQDFAESKDRFDLIVSNPPFFNNSLKPSSEKKRKARHADSSLSANDLMQCASKTLTPLGKIAIIIPANSCNHYINAASKQQLYCNSMLLVKPTPTKDAARALLEFSFIESTINTETLIIESTGRHEYSENYINLTKDFYLKM